MDLKENIKVEEEKVKIVYESSHCYEGLDEQTLKTIDGIKTESEYPPDDDECSKAEIKTEDTVITYGEPVSRLGNI